MRRSTTNLKSLTLTACSLAILLASYPAASNGSSIISTEGSHRIVRINPASGQVRTIFETRNGSKVVTLAAATRANRIAFVTKKKKYIFDGIRRVTEQIWIMRRDGSGLREVKRLVRKVRGRADVISPPRDDRGSRCTINAMDISEDGRKILIVRLFSMHEFRIGSGKLRYLSPDFGVFDPEYDPTGTRIAAYFSGDESGVGVLNLRRGKIQSLRDHRIDFFQGQPSFSPDGELIAFGGEKDAGEDPHPFAVSATGIWIMEKDGSNPHILPATKRSRLDFDAATFSPNGRSLAFTDTRYVKEVGREVGLVFTTGLKGRKLRVVFRDERGRFERPLAWIP